MEERKEPINLLLLGANEKALPFLNQEGFIIESYDAACISTVFTLTHEELATICNQDMSLKDSEVIIFLETPLWDFVNHLEFNNKPFIFEFDDTISTADECLLQIKSLIQQRAEKSMLVLLGSNEPDSDFALIPHEVAKIISALHYEAFTFNYSSHSFFKPLPLVSQIVPEEEYDETIRLG
jgi:hypothetical protein